MNIEQTLLCKLLSRLGKINFISFNGRPGCVRIDFHNTECGCTWESVSAPTKEEALKLLLEQTLKNSERSKQWQQALIDHVAEQRELQPLVQRELIEACPGRSVYELQAHVSCCFGGLADLAGIASYQFTVQVGDQRITGDTSMHQFDALQSLLDMIYTDPVANAKWTAYLERSR